ncbi:MAG: metal ABC transporter substrate-binding protein [Candidatus Hermodarchaeota archaeon]
MRRRQFLASVVMACLILGAVGDFSTTFAQTTPALNIGVSIQPLAGIVREIGGIQTSISVLLPEGIEPHTFTLTPSVIADANSADFLVLTGHFAWEVELANQTGKPYITIEDYEALGAELLSLVGYSEIIRGIKQQHDHSDNLHGYWLLPQNAIAIANATRIMCSSLNATFSQYWQERFDEFILEVTELEDFIAEQSQLHGFSGKRVVITFPAEAYVTEALGLDVVALLSEGENIFISGPELFAVEQALRNGSVNLILASDVARLQAAGEFAQQLSADSGVPLVWLRIVFSALEDYIGILAYNTGVVATGLGGGIPSVSDFLIISMPVIIIAAILGAIAIIELVLLIRFTRVRD